MRACLIYNPRSGRHNGAEELQPAIETFERAGWCLSVQPTTAPSDATDMAAAALQDGVDAVVIAGGDGTLNEGIQSLAGTEVKLGYIPYGTVNVWARELQMPLDPAAAAQAIVNGHAERIDLGRANDRYFLLMAGIGFDGVVVSRARALEHHKQRFGVLPYILAALQVVPRFRGADFELRYDGLIRRVQALLVVVGNTRLYGGRFHFTPRAVANDGWLDVCIVRGHGPLALLRQSLPLLLTGSIRHSDVELFRVRELFLAAPTPVPAQLDGELMGHTPLHFAVAPRSLSVIVPDGFRSDLIA